jgi:hypothetical protein
MNELFMMDGYAADMNSMSGNDDDACVFSGPPTSRGYPYDSKISLNYTYALDKISCIREFYFIHVTLAYLVVLSGIACFITRLVPSISIWHAFFGRAYILCMLWCMATSLLVHNSGLPIAVCISFLFVLLGLTLGWTCIKLHQHFLHGQMLDEVQLKLKSSRSFLLLSQEMKGAIHKINERKSWSERMLSFKAAHGVLMFVSWINMAGRIFGSNQSGDFTCHTYPVYKQLDSPKFKGFNHSLTYLPTHDPDYARMPWASSLVGWGLELSLLPLLGAAFIGGALFAGGGTKKQPLPSPPALDNDNNNNNTIPVSSYDQSYQCCYYHFYNPLFTT